MISQRSTHYWLWFLLFGVVAGLAYLKGNANLDGVPQSEPIWLLVTGFLGVIAGQRGLATQLSKPLDLILGILFTAVGILGLLHNFGITFSGSNIISNVGPSAAILGLSLALPFALIHTVLGLTSLNHGLRSTPVASPVVVNPGVTQASN